jgi:thioredoxin 1
MNSETEARSVPRSDAGEADRIRTVTQSTFTPMVLEGAGPIAVEFMSYGCAHCRVMEPVIQKVAELVAAEERIFRVNTAAEPGLAETYEIRGTPTLVMFLKGKEVGRVEGPRPTQASVLTAVRTPFES